MDWFHCNRCFRQEGARFAVTSCGHVLCEACGGAGPCPVCAAACRYLPISAQMRPQEKIFFRSAAAIALRRLAHVSQAWRFQRAQADLLLAFHRDGARRARAALEDARQLLEARERELQALRRENAELRRAQLSPAWRAGSRSSTPRPVGVTSPAQTVPPQPRRQLSGQVVSRPAPPEPLPPAWQVTPPAAGAGERPQNRPVWPQILAPLFPSPSPARWSPAPSDLQR